MWICAVVDRERGSAQFAGSRDLPVVKPSKSEFSVWLAIREFATGLVGAGHPLDADRRRLGQPVRDPVAGLAEGDGVGVLVTQDAMPVEDAQMLLAGPFAGDFFWFLLR